MAIAIIAAAGHGLRFGGVRAKQFVELAGVPLIIHTLKRFEQCAAIHDVVLVLPSEDANDFSPLAQSYGLKKVSRALEGAGTRAESVLRGLESLRAADDDIIAVHDGVRPFVTSDEIARTVQAAELSGAAILAAPAVDTIKEVRDSRVVRTVERSQLRRALTPQCFRYDLLIRAYQQRPEVISAATDDSSLVESLGATVTVVEGDPRNIKITTREDLVLAESVLCDF